jgi:predicted PhzF superfamily epimerase YddE/YHI9
VTGSTHSTLIPYWTAKLGARTLTAFQASLSGGYLEGRLAGDRVELTGRAATFMRATICLPD